MEALEIIVIAAIVISLGVGGFAFYKTFDGQWVCITEECIDYATGDEWVSENCRPQEVENITILACDMEIGEVSYKVPLSMVNLSHPSIKSCKEYVCSRQVFVK